MSKQQHIISVTAPDYQTIRENMTLRNFTCPVCNGKGSFSEQTGRDEWETTVCDYCDGTGKVKAVVEIDWKPDYDS